jgi:hypothetical protein
MMGCDGAWEAWEPPQTMNPHIKEQKEQLTKA